LACLIHVGMVQQARAAVAADAGPGLRAGDRDGVQRGGAAAQVMTASYPEMMHAVHSSGPRRPPAEPCRCN
jgi:hypothetical protein